MKALTVRQPWAWLIAQGYKDVENRKWPTPYRGWIAIHAGREPDPDYYQGVRYPRPLDIDVPPFGEIEQGGVVAVAELADCVMTSDSPWFCGPYGFVLRDVRSIPFIPVRGWIKLFELPPPVAAAVLRQLSR